MIKNIFAQTINSHFYSELNNEDWFGISSQKIKIKLMQKGIFFLISFFVYLISYFHIIFFDFAFKGSLIFM